MAAAPASASSWAAVHRHVGEEGEVVALARADRDGLPGTRRATRWPTAFVRASVFRGSANSFTPSPSKNGVSAGSWPVFSYSRRERLGRDLARLDVGLVERIDAAGSLRRSPWRSPSGRTPRPGRSVVVHVDADHRLAGLLERHDRRVLRRVRSRLQAQVGEQAIVAVGVRRRQPLAVDRDDALALLAGGLRDELLEPRAEIVDPGRRHQRELVAGPVVASAPRIVPSTSPGFSSAGTPGAQRVDHALGFVEQPSHVEAHDRRGHHAEVRQRGVATADRLGRRGRCGGSRRSFGLLLQAAIRDR